MPKVLIASRSLTRPDGKTVTLRLFAPEQDPVHGHYVCHFQVDGLPRRRGVQPTAGAGRDSLQALVLAVMALRDAVGDAATDLRWDGSDYLGLPREVPSGHSPEVDAGFDALVDRELERLRKVNHPHQPSRRGGRRAKTARDAPDKA